MAQSKPQESAASVELAGKGTKTLEELKAADADPFDQTYIDGGKVRALLATAITPANQPEWQATVRLHAEPAGCE